MPKTTFLNNGLVFFVCPIRVPLPAGCSYLSRRWLLIDKKSLSCFLVFPLLMVLLMLTGEKWERKITRYAHISKGRSQTREKESIHECSSGRLQKVMYGRETHAMYM